MRRDPLWGAVVIFVSLLSVVGGLGSTGWGLGTTTLRAATIGGALALLSAIRVVGGFGIARSARWGFGLTVALTVPSLVLDVFHWEHHTGHFGLPLNAAILYYCLVRLRDKERSA